MERVADSLTGQAGLLVELLTTAMEPDLAKAGLSLAMFELLSAIQSSGGRAPQVVVAERLGISPPSLSEAVRGAVKRGFVIQSASESDARVKQLRLTAKGRNALAKVLAGVARVETQMANGIDSAELARTIDLLRRINGNLARNIQNSNG